MSERVDLDLRVAGVEVLEVECRDRQLIRIRRIGGFALESVVDPIDAVRDLEEEVAEVVVDDTHKRTAVAVADVGARHGDDRVVGDKPFGVGVVRPEEETSTSRANARVGPVVPDDRRLAE